MPARSRSSSFAVASRSAGSAAEFAAGLAVGLAALSLAGCTGFGGSPPPPPPSPEAPSAPIDSMPLQISAVSSPPGARVTGGGTQLGVTPFVVSVPVPRPRAGETQAFAFTFELAGYSPQTLTAVPVNGALSLNVLLTPQPADAPPAPTLDAPPDPTLEQPALPPQDPTTGESFRVAGRGGGVIRDGGQATGTALVSRSCVIRSLDVTLEGRHTYYGDLVVVLQGPDGQRFQLQNHSRSNPFRRYAVRRAEGSPSAGTWRLVVRDEWPADSGRLTAWSLDFTCQ